MACIQYPRKERGGVSMGSWEKPTIYKDPPKEIMTRKKERVEEGDVTYNIRNNPSRYNDAITNWQKGKNMMVKVDYQNRSNQMTTMNFGSASNPYKVNQSFRPPEFRQVDLQPLSRQNRPYTAAQTNIGSIITRQDDYDTRMDNTEIAFSTNVQPVYKEANANVSREMGVYFDNFERKDMINDEYVAKQVLSKLKGIESVELQKLFSYENTPNGIILTPLSISTSAVLSGPNDVESQRTMEDKNYVKEMVQIGLGSNITGILHTNEKPNVNEQSFVKDHVAYTGQGVNSSSIMTIQQPRDENQITYIKDGVLVTGYTNPNGPSYIESQRNLSQGDSYTQHVVNYGQGVNQSGVRDIGPHNLSDELSYIQYVPQIGLGVNEAGVAKMGDRNIGEQSYLQYVPQIGLGVNEAGVAKMGDRNIGEQSYLQYAPQIGLGVNEAGVAKMGERNIGEKSYLQHVQHIGMGANPNSHKNTDAQRYVQQNNYVQNTSQVGLGVNNKSIQVQMVNEHQEKMKDILLKNMSSTVSIVIQTNGKNEEHVINGTIKDKIDIVIHSTKGTPLVLNRDNGEPIKLKEYTWKFIKSASGSDKFVIQVPHEEIQLERKTELYAMYSNLNQSSKINHDGDEIELRREMRPMSAATNLILSGDLQRVDENVLNNRVEKKTNYTDVMSEKHTPSLLRESTTNGAIRPHQSIKKHNITQTILNQSQGRFDS